MDEKTNRFFSNPWLTFLPFLVLYVAVVLALQYKIMEGDAGRYLLYADNLIHGFYAPRGTSFLWNGPGYPILLMPFSAVNAAAIVIALLNPLFLYASLVFTFKTILRFTARPTALFFTILWGLHYSNYKSLAEISTEAFTILLIALIAYYASRLFQKKPEDGRFTGMIILGGLVGYLALTKVIFGYVILAALLFFLLLSLLRRKSEPIRQALLVSAIALFFNIPYLIYTYHLTGQPFYWSNSGGMSLYWMSTPFQGEYGDWQSINFDISFEGRDLETLRLHHAQDLQMVYENGNPEYSGVMEDLRYKELALQNIRENPKKYLLNCLANTSRLLLGFPNSYQYENMKYLKYLPNIFLLALAFYSFMVSLFNVRRIPFELYFLLFLVFVYLLLTILVSAEPRMLLVVGPALMVWIAYTVDKTIRFKLFFSPDDDKTPPLS